MSEPHAAPEAPSSPPEVERFPARRGGFRIPRDSLEWRPRNKAATPKILSEVKQPHQSPSDPPEGLSSPPIKGPEQPLKNTMVTR